MDKLRIMLIIPEMKMGGAQRSLAKLSIEFARFAEVFIVLFNTDHVVEYPIGGTLLSLDVYPGTSFFSKAFSLLQRIRRLSKLKKDLAIDVSLSFLEGADYVNILSKQSDRVVVSVRGSKLHDETMHRYWFSFRKTLIRLLYPMAQEIVTVNKGIANELINEFHISQSKIRVIGNFYDIAMIESQMREEKSTTLAEFYKSPVIVTTGRMAIEKGLVFILRAFVEVKKKYPDLRWIHVGGGPEMERLTTYCVKDNLIVAHSDLFDNKPDVLFVGNKNNVFKYLHQARLFLLNSSSEGFPNGLMEALICGLPVVSSDCPYGPRDILAPELSSPYPITKPQISPRGILLPILNDDRFLALWTDAIEMVVFDERFGVDASELRNYVNGFTVARVMEDWKSTLLGMTSAKKPSEKNASTG